MSAIFGIVDMDGKPIDREDMTRMQQSMVNWGPDGSGT